MEEIFEGIHTRRDPDRIALLWTAQDGNEKRFTFGEFAARGNKLLNLFREKGLRKGDPVFVMLPVAPRGLVQLLHFDQGRLCHDTRRHPS